MAVLCLLGDDGTMVDRWEVSGRPMAIGRDETAEVIIEDETLSRRHFLIWRQGNKYLLKDLNSQNGTWVDGKPAQQALLRNNDCIRAGHTLFLFTEHSSVSAAASRSQRPSHDTAFLPAMIAAQRAAANHASARSDHPSDAAAGGR